MPSRSRRQRGAGASGAPLSYVNNNYREPSASAGSDIQISEPGLARPVLNPTGGRRRNRRTQRSRKQRRGRGGFYPSVMGNFIGNASRLAPVAAITGYRMIKNYNKTRKSRK